MVILLPLCKRINATLTEEASSEVNKMRDLDITRRTGTSSCFSIKGVSGIGTPPLTRTVLQQCLHGSFDKCCAWTGNLSTECLVSSRELVYNNKEPRNTFSDCCSLEVLYQEGLT